MSDGRCDVAAPSVTDKGPYDVDAPACEGGDGLHVPLPLGTFAVVEPVGGREGARSAASCEWPA